MHFKMSACQHKGKQVGRRQVKDGQPISYILSFELFISLSWTVGLIYTERLWLRRDLIFLAF